MNDKALAALTVGMLAMAEVLRQPPDLNKSNKKGESLVIEIYAVALGESSAAEIQGAIQGVLQEPGRVFFPTPGEIITHLLSYRRSQRSAAEAARNRTPALKPGIQEPVPPELRELIDRVTQAHPVPDGTPEAVRPLTEPPTPEEQTQLRKKQHWAITSLEEWKRNHGVA